MASSVRPSSGALTPVLVSSHRSHAGLVLPNRSTEYSAGTLMQSNAHAQPINQHSEEGRRIQYSQASSSRAAWLAVRMSVCACRVRANHWRTRCLQKQAIIKTQQKKIGYRNMGPLIELLQVLYIACFISWLASPRRAKRREEYTHETWLIHPLPGRSV